MVPQSPRFPAFKELQSAETRDNVSLKAMATQQVGGLDQ